MLALVLLATIAERTAELAKESTFCLPEIAMGAYHSSSSLGIIHVFNWLPRYFDSFLFLVFVYT